MNIPVVGYDLMVLPEQRELFGQPLDQVRRMVVPKLIRSMRVPLSDVLRGAGIASTPDRSAPEPQEVVWQQLNRPILYSPDDLVYGEGGAVPKAEWLIQMLHELGLTRNLTITRGADPPGGIPYHVVDGQEFPFQIVVKQRYGFATFFSRMKRDLSFWVDHNRLSVAHEDGIARVCATERGQWMERMHKLFRPSQKTFF